MPHIRKISLILFAFLFWSSSYSQLIFKETSHNLSDMTFDRMGFFDEPIHSNKQSGKWILQATYNGIQNEINIYNVAADGKITRKERYAVDGKINATAVLGGDMVYQFKVMDQVTGKTFKVNYYPGTYFSVMNKGNAGDYYELSMGIADHNIQKQTINYILPSGDMFYAFNYGVKINAWMYDANRLQDFKFIYPYNYDIVENGSNSHIKFDEQVDYSVLLMLKKIAKKNDTLILEIPNVLRNTNVPVETLKHMIFYPQNMEVVRYESAEKGKWRNSNNLLLFESENARDGWARAYFLLKKSDSTTTKADTVFVTKTNTISKTDTIIKEVEKIVTVHDTVFVNTGKATGSEADLTEKVVEKANIKLKSRNVEITVWDAATADGDIISLNLNGNWVVQNLKLTSCKNTFAFELQPGENILTMRAENLGSTPPNTAKFEFKSGAEKQMIQLRADTGYSESIKINVAE